MAACIPPGINFAPRQVGTTGSCVSDHLTDAVFLSSLAVCSFFCMFWSYTAASLIFTTTLNVCACVFYVQCLSTASFLSVSVSSTSLFLIGGNTDAEAQSISLAPRRRGWALLYCVPVCFSLVPQGAPCCTVYLSAFVSEGLFHC